MAKLLRLRRGTTTDHSTFTGAEGEVTVDTTKDTAVVHDGATAGGRPLLREDLSNLAAGAIGTASIADDAVTADKLANTAVTAGTYGSSSAIPSITVDAQGRITSASTSAIDSTAITNGTSNVSVAASGNITSTRAGTTRLTVNDTGIDVTGNITVSGTVDGRDVAADGTKLDGIASGAEVNVNADWNATSGDAQILNKPTIPAAANNGTIQINQGGSSKGSFTVNQSGNTTINLDGTGLKKSHASYTARTSISTGTGFGDWPGLSATINPNTTGKVAIFFHLVGSTGDNWGFRITRDGSPIGIGNGDGSRTQVTVSTDEGDSLRPGNASGVWYDQPGTGTYNYKIQYFNWRNGGSSGGTLHVNQATNTGNNNADQPVCVSSMLLLEV